jgi:uncharacterized protein (TIGR03435 family)
MVEQTALVIAQSPTIAFDVASIKPSPNTGKQSLVIRPNGFSATHQSLQVYIAVAYGGAGHQEITGWPDWAATERFDIIARTPTDSGRQEILAMLRTLLAERFGLRTHRESREVDGYALVLASGNRRSPGLRPVQVDCDSTLPPEAGPVQGLFAPERRPPCGASQVGVSLVSGPVLRTVRYSAMTMDRFALTLAGKAGRPVANRTGLTGTFDIELRYLDELPTPLGLPTPKTPQEGPAFRDALRQQLGLELRPDERVQVNTLVIDAVNQPTPD